MKTKHPTAMQVETVSIGKIRLDPSNVRNHPEKNLEGITASLHRFGQQKPIVVDAKGIIRAGNGTYAAAKSLGWKEIAVVRTNLNEPEAIAYAIADNRTAELAEWDIAALGTQWIGLDEELQNVAGFDQAEIDALLAEITPVAPIVEDEFPDATTVPQRCAAGDLWALGNHRLLCGSSRELAHVNKLLAGAKINVAVTSPPYASQRKYDEASGFKPIRPDEYLEWWDAVQAGVKTNLAPDGSFFLNIKEHCEDGQRSLYVKDLTLAHARKWGWMFVDEFCWTRPGVPMFQPNRFKNGWEPVFHFSLTSKIKMRHDNVKHQTDDYFQGGGVMDTTSGGSYLSTDKVGPRMEGFALPSNVIAVSARAGKEERGGHTASFPVELPAFFIKAFSDAGDVIYEPFCGSGTTMIAAEQLGRKCFGIEISPKYCDVIIARWEKLTGKTAEKVTDGTA